MKVLFILDHKLMNYRIPFFEQLAQRGYDITVVHPGPIIEDIGFVKQQKTTTKTFTKGLEYRLYNRSDANIVVFMQNIRIVNLWITTLKPFRN